MNTHSAFSFTTEEIFNIISLLYKKTDDHNEPKDGAASVAEKKNND